MSEYSIKDPIKRKRYLQKKYMNRHMRNREKVIQIIGNSCKYCGISDIRVLQIDHIHPINMGMKRLALTQIFPKIIRGEFDISNFQILCANCHAIKTRKERMVNNEPPLCPCDCHPDDTPCGQCIGRHGE